jgi:hypothetical protein
MYDLLDDTPPAYWKSEVLEDRFSMLVNLNSSRSPTLKEADFESPWSLGAGDA